MRGMGRVPLVSMTWKPSCVQLFGVQFNGHVQRARAAVARQRPKSGMEVA